MTSENQWIISSLMGWLIVGFFVGAEIYQSAHQNEKELMWCVITSPSAFQPIELTDEFFEDKELRDEIEFFQELFFDPGFYMMTVRGPRNLEIGIIVHGRILNPALIGENEEDQP